MGGGVCGTHPGSLYIITLHGPLKHLEGLTHPDPPLFRTLVASGLASSLFGGGVTVWARISDDIVHSACIQTEN